LCFQILIAVIQFALIQVDLSRSFEFRNSGKSYVGIPIMASNMDTTGTFEMAKVLSKVMNPLCDIQNDTQQITHDYYFLDLVPKVLMHNNKKQLSIYSD
jgi:hypothetical protein